MAGIFVWLHSLATRYKNYYGLNDLPEWGLDMRWEHSKSYYTFHRCISYLFIFVIHYRVLHTLAHCIRYLARRLIIRELLMFSVMNNIRAILPSSMGHMLWILMVIWYIHNTDAKCGTTFGHIGETRMENSIMMDFEVFLILNHLTLATFFRKVKWLKYRSQAIRNEQQTY